MDGPGGSAARIVLTVRGLVQGVGFRPFVARLAARHGLAGSVDNGPEGVRIVLEGCPANLSAFEEELRPLAPPLAVLSTLGRVTEQPCGLQGFDILPSRSGGSRPAALIPPDIATCPACLAELRDPTNRRHGYPFLNCTGCGPRYTIVDSLPYDRPGTSMRVFPLCEDCRREYEDPVDRRFHAQPTACPVCGPRLRLLESNGDECATDDPLREAMARLVRGAILAVKGLGGFHLSCDAKNADAVERLRRLKGRPHKPLAVMVRDLDAAAHLAHLSGRERELLASWRCPILLCRPRRPSPLAQGVQAGSALLGLFLPTSPLHHLLLATAHPALVMTSGNRAGEVLAHGNAEALERLAGIADAFLVHDREILAPLEDSVAREVLGRPVLLRRGRGWVPQPVLLARGGPTVLALGADLKGACCVTREGQAFPGACLGDMSHPENSRALEESARHLLRLLDVRPALVVHDLHPDYHSTRLAARLARELGAPLLAVQHHHAHALSVLAEHGVASQPVLAVCLDGTGHGPDGTIWGGEFLHVEGLRWRRLAHLRELPLPGGDRAAREPWRMGLAALAAVLGGVGDEALAPWRGLPCFSAARPGLLHGVLQELRRPERLPRSSSAGRLLDAAAALLGLCQHMSYEGQAAALLEDAASGPGPGEPYPFHLETHDKGADVLDTRPLLAALLDDVARGASAGRCSRRIHGSLAEMILQVARRARTRQGLDTVALSGGVFQNRLVVELATTALEKEGFLVLGQAQVSPNDEGISLGQAWAGLLSLAP
jgi:hydrogenase maturation protein HypF